MCLRSDVMSQNHYIAGLALTTFGNIASEQICRDVAPEIEQLCESDDPYVRKKVQTLLS
jgi:AP-1 complex subunit gamma-1